MSMGVYISGIEMPTDHPLWIVVHSDGTVEANEVSQSRSVGWQTLRNAAVPVPMHGRLGDLDALAESVRNPGIFPPVVSSEVLAFLRNAPTIIPASEEGET